MILEKGRGLESKIQGLDYRRCEMVSERDEYIKLLFAIKEESAAGQPNPFVYLEEELRKYEDEERE